MLRRLNKFFDRWLGWNAQDDAILAEVAAYRAGSGQLAFTGPWRESVKQWHHGALECGLVFIITESGCFAIFNKTDPDLKKHCWVVNESLPIPRDKKISDMEHIEFLNWVLHCTVRCDGEKYRLMFDYGMRKWV